MDELRELYQEVILDHGRNPRNFRRIENPDGEARGDNPLCGDRVHVFVTRGGADDLSDVAFQGRGCAITTASASMMTEIAMGRSESDARRLCELFRAMCTGDDLGAAEIPPGLEDDFERLRVMAGVQRFPMRVKCATLPWHTLTAALDGEAAATTE